MSACLHMGRDLLSASMEWPSQIRGNVGTLSTTFYLAADLFQLKNEHNYSKAIKDFRFFGDLTGVSEIFDSTRLIFNVIKSADWQKILNSETAFAVGNIIETLSWMHDYKIVHLSKKLNDTLAVVSICTSLVGLAALTKANGKKLKEVIVENSNKNDYRPTRSAACSLTSSVTQIGAIVLPLLSHKKMGLYCSIAAKTTKIAAFLIDQSIENAKAKAKGGN